MTHANDASKGLEGGFCSWKDLLKIKKKQKFIKNLLKIIASKGLEGEFCSWNKESPPLQILTFELLSTQNSHRKVNRWTILQQAREHKNNGNVVSLKESKNRTKGLKNTVSISLLFQVYQIYGWDTIKEKM